jgi:hypothetical protein
VEARDLPAKRCGVSDIANELRERSLRAEQEGEPLALLDEAADEIERLRLTDEEREVLLAIEADASYRAMERTQRVVRGLLDRLG